MGRNRGRGIFQNRGEAYCLTADESHTLDAYILAWNPGTEWRHTYSEDRDAYIYEHRQAECAVWRRGVGILVHRTGFHPAQRLAEEGR